MGFLQKVLRMSIGGWFFFAQNPLISIAVLIIVFFNVGIYARKPSHSRRSRVVSFREPKNRLFVGWARKNTAPTVGGQNRSL